MQTNFIISYLLQLNSDPTSITIDPVFTYANESCRMKVSPNSPLV